MSGSQFKSLLGKVVSSPSTFTSQDLSDALVLIFTEPYPDPAQIGAFLLAVHTHHIERQPGCLSAAAQVLRQRALRANVIEKDFVVDIVGTGGDGHDTFNVSTTAAIVAAGAGARVAKHGSRAATSSSGSADLLQSLGVHFTSPTRSSSEPQTLPNVPFQFLLAPLYHPAMSLVAPIRKSLPFRTIFNLLGPLINPAKPSGMILGIPDPALGPVFANALRESGTVQRAMVVCGEEWLDEISCAGPTHAWILNEEGIITKQVLHPVADFGLSLHPLADVKSSTPDVNAKTLETLLTSGSDLKPSPILDYVLLNTAALLVVSGIAATFKDGVKLGRESITSGKAWEALQIFIRHQASLKEQQEINVNDLASAPST